MVVVCCAGRERKLPRSEPVRLLGVKSEGQRGRGFRPDTDPKNVRATTLDVEAVGIGIRCPKLRLEIASIEESFCLSEGLFQLPNCAVFFFSPRVERFSFLWCHMFQLEPPFPKVYCLIEYLVRQRL